MSRLYERMSAAVLEGNAEQVVKLVERALSKDLPAKDILDNGLVPGMDEVGVDVGGTVGVDGADIHTEVRFHRHSGSTGHNVRIDHGDFQIVECQSFACSK